MQNKEDGMQHKPAHMRNGQSIGTQHHCCQRGADLALAPLRFGLSLLCVGNLNAQHPREGAVFVGKCEGLQIESLLLACVGMPAQSVPEGTHAAQSARQHA